MKKLLVVVDYQNDFVDGALGFAGAELLEPKIAAAVKATLDTGGYVLFTRDTHEAGYLETREGRYLPVAHCIRGEKGHGLYGRLAEYEGGDVPNTAIIDKPTFGCAGIGEAAERLCGGAPGEISLCGLVTDICVISNAILLHTAFPLAQVQVLEELCGSGNAQGADKALDVLRGLGIGVV